jgi:hypothetical protein
MQNLPIKTVRKARVERILTAKQRETLKSVSEDGSSSLKTFKKAYSALSPATGIKAKCLERVWLDREAIRTCNASECPLWPYRPYQTKQGEPK